MPCEASEMCISFFFGGLLLRYGQGVMGVRFSSKHG